jgi:hypothetical protein
LKDGAQCEVSMILSKVFFLASIAI